MDIAQDTVLLSHRDSPQIQKVKISDIPHDGDLLMGEVVAKLDVAIKLPGTHDPHKVPPQALKDIFKKLRSIKDKDDPRIAAHRILDFSIHQPTESARRVLFLDRTFDCFHSQTPVTHPAMLGNPLSPTYLYTAGDVPGRHIHSALCHCSVEVTKWDVSRPISLSYSRLESHLT